MRTLLLSLLLLVPAACQADPVYDPGTDTLYYFVTTGQTGAQVQLDTKHTVYWTFNPTASFWLGGGKFDLKEGSHTSGDTTFTVSENGTPINWLTFNNATWATLHPGNPDHLQQFEQVPYLLSRSETQLTPPAFGAILLQASHSYTIALTSSAADRASEQYFIKDPNVVGFYDGSNTQLTLPPEITYNGPTPLPPIPEPSTWLLLTGGMGLLAVARRYRHAR